MCDHTLSGAPLICTRPDVHVAGKGCVFEATGGPDLSGEASADE